MARHQVRVLATSDEAAELAQQRLATRGAVDCVGAFKLGWADDADVQDLEAVGCVVELIPPDPKLGWLEPGEQPVSLPADALSDEGRSPVLASLAGTSPDYYVVQFAGPLHPQWCEQVQKLGIKIGQSVPGFANKMALTPQQKEELELLPFVRRVVEFDRAHTLRRLAYAPPRSSPVPLVERPMQRLARRIIVQSLNALGATWIGRSLGVDRILPTAPSAGAESALGAARPTESARADEGLTFDVKCHNAADLPIIAEALKQEPRVGRVDLGRNRLRFQVKNVSAMDQLLVELAELPQVSVIERYQIPQITVSFVREVLGLQMGGPPLSANGEVIGIADTGVDAEHPDLRNHILDVTYWAKPDNHRDPVGHGTHVAGIVCGDGMASNGGLIGVAPDAKIFVQALADSGGELSGVPVDLNKLFQEAYDVGARIHNNSWGVLVKGIYTIDSYEVDQFAYEHPDFLVVIAAGNAGQQGAADPNGRIDMNSLYSPAAAKNALTVGACCSTRANGPYAGKTWRDWQGRLPAPTRPLPAAETISGDADVVAAFSSRGPTDESRIKPDLLAPGTEVGSARSAFWTPPFPYTEYSPYYAFQSGTSMAAPAVAGAAAIVRHWYRTSRGVQPSAALLKATLVNGTIWIKRLSVLDDAVGQPNHHQGFGRLHMPLVIPSGAGMELAYADIGRDAPQALLADQPTRAMWRQRLEATGPGELSVTLTWTDPPGHGLQHHLSLIIVAPDGAKFLGNDQLKRGPFEKLDRTNNVQQVRLTAMAPGTYLVIVTASNTLFGSQGFAIVATGPITPQFS